MDGSGFESHIARAARDRYGFADRLFSNVVVVDLAASRDLAHRMNTVRDADRRPDHLVHPGALNAMRILDEVMHLVLALFREDPATRATPVIAVTASVMAQERQKVMNAGFDGSQGKPISVRELLETVRQILDKSPPG